MKHRSIYLKLAMALAALLCSLAAGIIISLQSDWVSHHIRQVVINGVEDATGAHVEIPSFTWDWRTLTVEMRGFTMHGFEPASGPPLFTSPLIRSRLRILSLLNQDVQLSSLVVTRPRFYLMVEADGKTNIPGPKHVISPREIVNTLADLRLPHIEAVDGWAQINSRSFPVSLVGDHVALLIQFRKQVRHYQISLRSPALRIASERVPYFDGSVHVQGELWRDHLSLIPSRFHSSSSDVTVSGSLYEFNNPVIDWRIASSFATSETLQRFGIKHIAGGLIRMSGTGHHDPQTPLFFDGQVAADHVSVSAPSAAISGLRLRDASLHSRIVVDSATVKLPDLALTSAEGRFAGRATLTNYRNLQLSGALSGIDLQTVGSAATHKSVPWSATIGGPVELKAVLLPELQDLESRGDLVFQPKSAGIPLSGDIHYRYRERDSNLVIEESHLDLPGTHLVVSGQPRADVAFEVNTNNFADFEPGLSLFDLVTGPDSPALAKGGSAHLRGSANLRDLRSLQIAGTLEVLRLKWKGVPVNRLQSAFELSPSRLQIQSLKIDSPLLQSDSAFQLALSDWRPGNAEPFQASGTFSRAQVDALSKLADPALAKQIEGGSASGSFALQGTPADPVGTANLKLLNLIFHGEHLDTAEANLALAKHRLTVSSGQLQSAGAAVSFGGAYTYGDSPLRQGTLQLNIDSNRFPLSRLNALNPALNRFAAQMELHLQSELTVEPGRVSPRKLSGYASLQNILYDGAPVGNFRASAVTEGSMIEGQMVGDLRGSKVAGSAKLQIAPGTPATGNLSFDPVQLATILAILQPSQRPATLLSGSARGSIVFNGPLETPSRLHALLQLRDLQITGPPLRALGEDLAQPATAASRLPSELILQSSAPVTIELNEGVASVRSAEFTGRDTRLTMGGSAGLLASQPLHLDLKGGIDLRLLQLLYPDIQISGQSKIDAAVSGTIPDPQLAGSIQLTNASIYSALAPTGLSDLNGTIRFDQHRATLDHVSAHTGGGSVTFGGFVSYSANHPLVYRLDSSGQNIRVRYANGISITGNSQFSFTGTSEQSLLSGGVTISRIVLNPNADLGNLLATSAAPAVASNSREDYLSKLQMDIHVESAPNLQLDTALSSNVATELDLELRGTPKQPMLLGSIEANQGDIKVFGSRFTINRGQISFNNAARLEPILDLDLQTQARGITVDITVSGTLNKLNINYRSDPPLLPRDIIALLTLGQTPQSTLGNNNVSVTNDNSLNSGTNSVLGQAIAPVSNRLSKLFGITNIKIDPLVQGITNTPQARLTLEQQISRQITVTYVTNLAQTSEQIFRVEYSLNPQFSLIALRDDNGEFGIDILYKKRFK